MAQGASATGVVVDEDELVVIDGGTEVVGDDPDEGEQAATTITKSAAHPVRDSVCMVIEATGYDARRSLRT